MPVVWIPSVCEVLRSKRATDSPRAARRRATCSPARPAPATATSKDVFMAITLRRKGVTVKRRDHEARSSATHASLLMPHAQLGTRFMTVTAAVPRFGENPAMFGIAFLLLVLAAPPATESIVVTAHPPGPLGDTAEDVNVVSRTALQTNAAPAVDDALRQVPGFTLFRRTDSRTANPTSQGVSLRGIGASGASRALVLDDGIPLNDPFGGWVYWGRVPEAALERVEVLRGGVSDLYGSSAMGGVIAFVRRDGGAGAAGVARVADIQLDASRGSDGTRTTSLFAAVPHLSIAADLFDTDGYVLTQPSQRGAVDVAATSRHTSLDATVRNDMV